MYEPLNSYNYEETLCLKPKNYNVKISSKDHVIVIEEDGSLAAQIALFLSGGTLSLKGKDDELFGSVELPLACNILNGKYNTETQSIEINIAKTDGTTDTISIGVADLIDIYKGGNGIEIDENNVISVKINDNSSDVLSADESGLTINLSDYAKETDLSKYALDKDLDTEIEIREDEISGLTENLLYETKRATEKENLLAEALGKKLDITAYTPYDDTEIKKEISGITEELDNKLDISAYTPYDDTEIRGQISAISESLDEKVEQAEYDEKIAEIEEKLSGITESVSGKVDYDEYDTEITYIENNIYNLYESVSGKVDYDEYTTTIEGIEAELDNKLDVSAYTPYDDTEIRGQISAISESLDEKVEQAEYDEKVAEIEENISGLTLELGNKLDISAYTEYDDEEIREAISGITEELDNKLDASAYTEYNDTEIREAISGITEELDNKLDASAYTEYNDTEIREAISGITEELDNKLDASAYTEYNDTEIREAISGINETLKDKVDYSEYNTQITDIENDISGLTESLSKKISRDTMTGYVDNVLLSYVKTENLATYVEQAIQPVSGTIINSSITYTNTVKTELENDILSATTEVSQDLSSAITKNANELHVLSVCNDGDEYDSAKAMTEQGTGAFDEVYRLVHLLLKDMSEADVIALNTKLKDLLSSSTVISDGTIIDNSSSTISDNSLNDGSFTVEDNTLNDNN